MNRVLNFETVDGFPDRPSAQLEALGPYHAVWVNSAQWASLLEQLRGTAPPQPLPPAELTVEEFTQELLTADGKIQLSIDISPMANACHRASKEITGLLTERRRLAQALKRTGVDIDQLVVGEIVLEDLAEIDLRAENGE